MRSSSLYSFLGIALCVGASLAGCSGDDDDDEATNPSKTSAEGESCQSTANCASNLVCVGLVCVKGGAASGGTGGGGGSAGSSAKGGSSGSGTAKGGSAGTTPAPVLGGEGESCTKRADCAADLHCYNLRCTAGETGMAGGGGTGPDEPPLVPVLGQVGETCVLPSDCMSGLTCLPGSVSGQEGVGVCGTANTGITPTGKTCAGECEADSDCCQLPLAMLELLAVKSCADLEQKLTGVDCDDPGANANLCFVQATYCTCDDTWACDDSLCVYQPDCSADGLTTEGCPTHSRANRTLVSTCVDNECAPPPLTGCTADADCDTTPVADDQGDTCSPGECTCYKANAQCYRKCDDSLDCAFGYTCDTKKTHVCVAGDACVDDVFCQKKLGDINAVCDAGTCSIGCSTDLDCNASFVAMGFASICNQTKHVCESFGCRSNADCDTPVHMFCIDTPEASAGTTVASAITD